MENLSVLHVDDEPSILEQTKIFLEKEDERFNIETTTSPKEALKKVEEGDYDAIISDYQMPEMDGIEFLRILREEKNNDIPFIVFTGKGREEVALEALNLGADRYLRKGTDPKAQYGILANALDQEITHRKFERKKDFFKLSAIHAPEAIFVSDRNANITYVNEQAANNLGYSVEELEDMNIFDIDPDFSQDNWKEHWKEVKEEGKIKIESEHKRKDGSTFPVELLINHVKHEGNKYHFTFARDISEYKQFEKELEKGKAQVQLTAENSGIIMYRLDRDFRFQYVNTKTLSFMEKSEEEVLNEKFQKIFPNQKLEKFLEALNEVFNTGEGKEIRHELNGKIFRSLLNPIPDPDTGEIEFVLINSKDITERVEAQEREEFLHSLLRHNLRNKLNTTQGYLEEIREKELTEDLERYLDLAIETQESGLILIEKIRTLRKLEEEEIKPVKVSSVLRDAIEQKENLASKKNINIESSFCDCEIQGGPLLEELFTNLIENSIIHSGCDEIEIRIQEKDEECIISVTDDGKGIPEEEKEKVFEKGYKFGKKSGSGLGLFLVKRITEKYGGNLELKNPDGEGTKFNIHLKKA